MEDQNSLITLTLWKEENGFPQKVKKNTEQLVIDLASEMGISIRLYVTEASHRLSKREKLIGL